MEWFDENLYRNGNPKAVGTSNLGGFCREETEVTVKAELSLRETGNRAILQYDIVMKNQGEKKTVLEDFYVDFPLPPIVEEETGRAERDDYFIVHPVEGEVEKKLLIFPYGGTQLELCEADWEKGRYRCYLYARKRKRAACYQNIAWRNPSRVLELKSGESRKWTFYAVPVKNEKEITELLMQYGKVPFDTKNGINGMRTVGHHFTEEPLSLSVYRQLANSCHSGILTNGRLSSLKRTKGSIEAIDREQPFGDIRMRREDGTGFSTVGTDGFEAGDGSMCFCNNGLSVKIRFALKGKRLRYFLTLKNETEEKIILTDLMIPVPLNSRMGWGTDPAKRMIRHSQVAGDNSFFLATPCDGTAPYLLCIPHEGTRWELFDTMETDRGRTYCVYIHGEGAARRAGQKEGGRWRLPVSCGEIDPGECLRYGCDFQWVDSYEEARNALVKHGKVDVQAIPGLTVPQNQKALFLLRSDYDKIELLAEYPEDTEIELLSEEKGKCLYQVQLKHLGENRLTMRYGGGKEGWIETFSTLPIETLLQKRAQYIAGYQCRDAGKWYDGLLRERNTKTGALLDPDHHDEIVGWRIYEITCDDPGLSKPAFLAAKNAELPRAEEVEALDYYIGHFVWGGLQRTDREEYPYGIYGIPDWHDLRERKNYNANERYHIWRIYDYPHIILLYFKMYEIARNNPDFSMKLDAREYLQRAYGTCLAMYQYPFEIEHTYAWSNGYWSPYKTGFYNEVVIMDVIEALRRERMPEQARRLEYHWQHKADYFIRECSDLFGSEYAFDTTGFESTQAFVDWGRKNAGRFYNSDERSLLSYTISEVEAFDQKQRSCNIACRGYLENAYYLTGSDIRGESTHYTLGYMSQMGGWALMQDALYSSDSPFELLRLGYTSLLSSWALLNAGKEEDDFGYWYPGIENDGAGSGGFEAAPSGMTWLGQPAWKGVWIYGCETDLGYCGYLRGAATVLAEDPDFGEICYGGIMEKQGNEKSIYPTDGVGRRFHWIRSDEERLHVLLEGGRMQEIRIRDNQKISISIQRNKNTRALMHLFTQDGEGEIMADGKKGSDLFLDLTDKEQIEITYANA